MPSLPPPSTTATIDDATINAVGLIPPLLPSTMTAIATINDCRCPCHSIDNDNCQKPGNGGSSTKAVVNSSQSNGGLC
jgi:hypothetical protein